MIPYVSFENQPKPYTEAREDIQSGDVIFFEPKQKLGWGKLITWWTKSNYSHVGMAIRAIGRVWILEASETGRVKLVPLSGKGDFTLIQTCLDFSKIEDIACAKVDAKYDYLGALKAAFGRSRNNDSYYCSELITDLLIKAGLPYLRHPQTPASLFNYFTEYQEFNIIEVKEA